MLSRSSVILLGSWSGVVNESPDAVYQKAMAVISATGMSIVSTVPPKSIAAEMKVWPLKADKIIVSISGEGDKSTLMITTSGSKSDAALTQLVGILRV